MSPHDCADGWLSEPELLEEAARRGCAVTKDKLHRWRQGGLIPRSRQGWLEGQPGSHSCYPPDTLDVLVAVNNIHREEKRLDIVGFELWWRGSEFHRPVARRALNWYVTETWRSLVGLSERSTDPHDVADAVYALLRGVDPRTALHRLLIRRVNRNEDAFLSAVYAITVVMLGRMPAWGSTGTDAGAADADERSPESAVAGVLGVDRLAVDAAPFVPRESLDSVDVVELLRDLQSSRVFDAGWIQESIASSEDSMLDQVREWSSVLAEGLPAISRAADEWFATADFAGLSVFATLAKNRRDYLRWRLALVTGIFVLEKSNAVLSFSEFSAEVESAANEGRVILALRDALPQHAEYLHHDWEKKLAELPQEDYVRILGDIRAFLNESTELKNSLIGHNGADR